MQLSELKNWDYLTKKEKERLKKIYGEDTPITKTMAERAPKGKYYKKDHGLE